MNSNIKTITIRQGSGDDALEMTVQVTQEELEKMEELRSKNPQKWPTYSLELIKEAREALAKPSKYKSKKPQSNKSKRKWLWIVLAFILAAIGIAIWLFTRNTSIIQGNDLAFRQLDGPVNTVYTLEFDAVNVLGEGNIILDKPRIEDVTIMCFDRQGYQIKKEKISISSCSLDVYSIDNEQGLPLELKRYSPKKGLFEHSFYEYDEKGNKIKKTGGILGVDGTGINAIDTYYYKFDEKDRIIKMVTQHNDGTPPTIATTQYDALGRIIKYVNETPSSSWYSEKTDYQYLESGLFKFTKHYLGVVNEKNLLYFESEKWVYDKENHRNDRFEYDENGKLKYKDSYYYDNDSSIYMLKTWGSDGKPGTTYNYFEIDNPNDSVYFTTQIYDDKYRVSHISMKIPRQNGFEYKSFSVKSDLSSSMSGIFDDPAHQTVKAGENIMSIEYDKMRNPKFAIYTFSDGETIKTKYSYRGREKNWKRIEISHYDNGEKETTTNTYSGYNLLSSIESNGHEEYWEYNEQGEEVSYRELKGGVITTNIKYSDYVYDKYDNWIRRTNYNVSNGAYTITERCIEYY